MKPPLFSFFNGKPNEGDLLKVSDNLVTMAENPFDTSYFEKMGKYPECGSISAKVKKEAGLLSFFPEGATKHFKIKDSKNKEGLSINVSQKINKGQNIMYFPVILVASTEDELEFFPSGVPYFSDNLISTSTFPVYSFMNPVQEKFSRPLFNFSVSKEDLKNYEVKGLDLYPLWEHFDGHYMCRGVFFPTYKLRSLSFRGTGEIKYLQLMNFTPEPVTFRWLVPNKWKDKVGWLLDGKMVHKVYLDPFTRPRQFGISAFIDDAITSEKELVNTLVIAQSENRLEWFHMPLFPNREKGDFFLDPKDVNPKLL